ncbi:MAG: glycoside hydrolase [Actinomycetota bacterium]|nr:glycoside hydrolase [Actinomycetota bacterium]
MRCHRLSYLLALAAAVALVPWASAGAAPLKQPEVDGAVQVTSDLGSGRGHATPVLAMHPDDPQTLVLAEGDAYTSRCMVHVSRNGGLTWSNATQPQTPPDWPGCGFAVTGALADLAFAPDGTLYYAFSAFQPTTYQQRIYLARSSDLGMTWTTTALPRIGPNPARREFGADAMPSIVVDRDDPTLVYVAWWSNNGIWNMPESITGASGSIWCRLVENRGLARPWLSVSHDGGATFSDPVDMAPGIGHCTTEPYLTQGKDGAILAFFGEATRTLEEGKAPPAHLYFSASTDQGKTFTVTPVHTQSGPADGRASTSTSDWLSAPSPGVDPKTGAIYVTWEEMGQGTPQILFARSTDKGKTWSEPVKVNDVDPKRDWDFADQMPTLGVAPNGRIDVAWYDYRNDPTFKEGDTRNGFQDVYYASSTDGGRTWSKNRPVNDRIIDRRFGSRRTGSIYGPLGLVSTDKAAYVAWDDTRNGNEQNGNQDIYFTRVRYVAPAEVFAGRPDNGMSPWVAGLLGASIAVALGGLIVVIGAQDLRRRRQAEDAPAGAPSVKEPSVT